MNSNLSVSVKPLSSRDFRVFFRGFIGAISILQVALNENVSKKMLIILDSSEHHSELCDKTSPKKFSFQKLFG